MATESCTITGLNYCELCAEFELENNKNEHLPADRWEVHLSDASELTGHAWMKLCFAMNRLYFCFVLDACILVSALVQRIY